jgi:FAD:protein FMN transferase
MKRLLVFVLLLSVLSGCTSVKTTKYDTTILNLFDTVTTFIAYAPSQKAFDEEAKFMEERLNYYHQQFDIYNEYPGINNLRTVNKLGASTPIKVDQELIDFLLFCKEMYVLTNGKTNIALGSVLELWHDYRAWGENNPDAQLPPMSELQQANRHVDINNLVIDDVANTVAFKDHKMLLDVGAIAKGYATQKVTDELKAKGYNNFIISVGGNVCAVGTKNDGKLWRVGVQNPDLSASDSTILDINLQDQTIVTSGDYQRFYEVDGVRYHHLIDPSTLMPANYMHAVSIVTADSGKADALSTAVFLMPVEEGKKLVESLDGVEAIFILNDMSVVYSSGFEALIIK